MYNITINKPYSHIDSRCLIYVVLLLILVVSLLPQNLIASEYDYYSNNPATRHGIEVVQKNHWNKAMSAVKNMRFNTAKGELSFILRWVPNHPQALHQMSNIMIKAKHPEDALPYLDTAIKFGPNHENNYNIYGVHLFKSNRVKDAIEKFNAALAINPNSSEIHYNIGLAYFKIEDYINAKVHGKKAYSLGYPLPGLKNKLKSVGQWNNKLKQNQ